MALDERIEAAADFWSDFTWGRAPGGRRGKVDGPHLVVGAPPVLVHLARFIGFELVGGEWWAPKGLSVCCDPEGRRAFLAGRASSWGDSRVWGETIAAIHYRVQKGDEPLATWRHEFEGTRPRLALSSSAHDGRDWPHIAGGTYHVHRVYGFVG